MHSINTIITLALGIASVLSTWIITGRVKRGYDRFQEDEFRKHSITVTATIVSLRTQSAWKSTSWGTLGRKRTRETCSLIVAEWTPPQTHTTYTFHFKQWKNEQNTDLIEGGTLVVLVDSRDPTSYTEGENANDSLQLSRP